MDSLHSQDAGLTHRDELPLRLSTVSAVPDAAALQRQRARNEMLLRVCIALQDHHEAEERDEISAELARLDLKLDLLISCVHQLVAASNSLPPPVPVVLTAEGLSWPWRGGCLLSPFTDEAPRPGYTQPVLVELFVNPLVPMPLALHGHLAQVDMDTDEPRWQVTFDALAEPLVGLLEKLIFRYHRRAVAMGLGS
jgi:hypothetical protein